MKDNNVHLFQFNNKKYAYINRISLIISLNDLSYKVFKQHNKYNNINKKELIDDGYEINRIEKIIEVYNRLKLYNLFDENIININLNNITENKIYNSATLFLTENCNLDCVYCYESNDRCNKVMDKKIVTNTLEFLKKNSFDNDISISLFGGEPLLSVDLIEFVIEETKRLEIYNKVKYTITTNGTLFNKKVFELLKENKIGIALSMDGTKTQQNINRPLKSGKGSFELIEQNIYKYFDKLKENLVVRSTITKNNIDLKDIYNQMEKYDFDLLILNLAATDNENLKLSNEEYKKIIKDSNLIAEDYVYKIINNMKFITPSFISMWLTQLYPSLRRSNYCGVSENSIAVDINGNVYGCHRFVGNTKMVIGNILSDESFKIRSKREVYKSENEECINCWCNLICNGGCLHENYIFNKTNDMNLICDLRQRWIEMSLGVYAEICSLNPDKLVKIIGNEIFSNENNRFLALDKV